VGILLDRWARLTGRSPPEAAPQLSICRLPRARCAPRRGGQSQAERIRADRAHRRSGDEIIAAIRGLRRFLTTPTQGVWFDQLGADDVFIVEPARATSLYHIIGAVAQLSPNF
jgi:N-acylglucosamine 2-epimerase (GlcNAc 2-epimerase)